MIGICTDSNAQLPPELIERYGIEVVPITITIEDHEYLEGVNLDVDAFYGLWNDGAKPDVRASEPSPGQFALAYEQLIERGATEILSLHVGLPVAAAVNSARLGAHKVAVPVRIVDTGSVSFGVGSCVWAAARAIETGACLESSARIAEEFAPNLRNVFVLNALDLLSPSSQDNSISASLFTLANGVVCPIDSATTAKDAAERMAAWALDQFGPGAPIGVAVGFADAGTAPLALAIRDLMLASSEVRDCVMFRLGPSVGAQAGPGTAGLFVYPA